MDLGLKGKCAFVAASSRGLGYATALGLAKEGCNVAINGRDEDSTREAADRIAAETGGKVLALFGDVTDPETPARLIGLAVEEFGALDILITNAGGPPAGSFETIDD
ncbi:MAG TPA: SDR family NAD(P)-dependent oxidoreductase, partial [Anaerolineales bacterium]